MIAAICVITSFVFLVLPTGARESAAASLRGSLVAPMAGLQQRSELSRRLFLAHDDAVQIADSVTLRSLRLAGVEQENVRLRKLLGLASAVKWGFIPAEALRGRGLGEESTVALSAGRIAGVEPLSPVVVAEGLVGMIERVDNSLSLAIVWPHPDFRVSAMAADGSAFGIVRAHAGSRASRYLLELQGVQLRTQLKPGTLVVASGFGGVYPKGIPIGTVEHELKTGDGFARSYLVRPAVRLTDISSVMILTSARVRAGIENVWVQGVSADSASKGAVAAGDSVRARDRAVRESVRRDSVRRDSVRRDSVRRDSVRRVP